MARRHERTVCHSSIEIRGISLQCSRVPQAFGSLEQRPVGDAGQGIADRESPNADVGELSAGRPSGDEEDVDRCLCVLDDPGDGREIGQSRGVDSVGSCVSESNEAPDRIVEVISTTKVILGPGREDESRPFGGDSGGRHSLHRHIEFFNLFGQGVPILDGAAGRSRFGEKLDGRCDTSRAVGEALFGIDVYGQMCDAAHGADMFDQGVAANSHVLSSKRRRQATTRRGQSLESERREQATRPEIVRVGHQEGALEVEGTESGFGVIEVHALIIAVGGHKDKRKTDFYVDVPGS